MCPASRLSCGIPAFARARHASRPRIARASPGPAESGVLLGASSQSYACARSSRLCLLSFPGESQSQVALSNSPRGQRFKATGGGPRRAQWPHCVSDSNRRPALAARRRLEETARGDGEAVGAEECFTSLLTFSTDGPPVAPLALPLDHPRYVRSMGRWQLIHERGPKRGPDSPCPSSRC